jgi:NAD(P)-dependent dehydrogenase (short-subunit alcohol dehydrogenase family)
MRSQRNGIIVNISSIGGRIAFPFSPSYASTKFAIEGLSEALQYEVAQFGIRIILIEPGIIRTSFFENMKRARKAEDPSSPYLQLLQKRIGRVKRMFDNGTAAEDVANVILKAVTSYSEERNLRYVVGSDATLLTEKRRSMTDGEFFNFMSKHIFNSTN